MKERALLKRLAQAGLGAEDADVVDGLAEQVERFLFLNHRRTNPRGYYLDVVTEGVKDAEGNVLIPAALKSANKNLRLNLEVEYRNYRNDLFTVLDRAIPEELRPRTPLDHVRLMFVVMSNRPVTKFLDAEAKYSSCKPLIDCLQPNTTFMGSGKKVVRRGVGILKDDTDGEHELGGVIRQLEVVQRQTKGNAKLRIIIEETLPWKP